MHARSQSEGGGGATPGGPAGVGPGGRAGRRSGGGCVGGRGGPWRCRIRTQRWWSRARQGRFQRERSCFNQGPEKVFFYFILVERDIFFLAPAGGQLKYLPRRIEKMGCGVIFKAPSLRHA